MQAEDIRTVADSDDFDGDRDVVAGQLDEEESWFAEGCARTGRSTRRTMPQQLSA